MDMEKVTELLTDFVGQLLAAAEATLKRFVNRFSASFTTGDAKRWVRVLLIVFAYLLVRPYIDRFFKWSYERDRLKREEKKKKEEEAFGVTEDSQAKVSANSLRGGGAAAAAAPREPGKVLGEVENSDDEINEAEEFATASGVPEWGKNARKRQKKYQKNLEKGGNTRAKNLSEDQIKELLEWSDSE
ncbi:hypothetical protein ASPZODRAFT_661190 [Penicilliopsis zonata CBS 506.65]|uniref:Protein trafficking Pga2 n=1 Tax=Penicilliopsis zonata CBS 506.65 TaxID=1073090 RepID=A0A1L9SCS6_9EURO|nr:hypothetical protein ASPZODRAFT_661190 [Penicilliopsis zonata CBS 506.65]OJJ44981.1 hypothetical protein ASPZODRAFT_661190 [Penicilliopsis zonata CBS 506.65]